jgi:hypothetical protein
MEINNNSVHCLSGGIQGSMGSEWSIIMQCHLKEMMSTGWLRYTMFEGSTGVPQNRFWSDRTSNDRMVDLCILKRSRGKYHALEVKCNPGSTSG